MRTIFLGLGLTLATLSFNSCQQPENTPTPGPEQSFVIGDEAFYERFNGQMNVQLHRNKYPNSDNETVDWTFHEGSNQVINWGLQVNGLLYHVKDSLRDIKSLRWNLRAYDVIRETLYVPQVVSQDSTNGKELHQFGNFVGPPLVNVVNSGLTPISVIKAYDLGDTVNWVTDHSPLRDDYSPMSGYRFDGDWYTLFEVFDSEDTSNGRKIPTMLRERKYGTELFTPKFIVCKYLWYPQKANAQDFKNRIQKLAVIELSLDADSIIQVENVYIEKVGLK